MWVTYPAKGTLYIAKQLLTKLIIRGVLCGAVGKPKAAPTPNAIRTLLDQIPASEDTSDDESVVESETDSDASDDGWRWWHATVLHRTSVRTCASWIVVTNILTSIHSRINTQLFSITIKLALILRSIWVSLTQGAQKINMGVSLSDLGDRKYSRSFCKEKNSETALQAKPITRVVLLWGVGVQLIILYGGCETCQDPTLIWMWTSRSTFAHTNRNV